jgi:hypothetical protein
MIEETFDEREMAFLAEAEKYEGKWIAIANYDSDKEIIVGSGVSLKEARRSAEASGFKDVTFFKVPPSNRVFIPIGVETNAT